MANKNSNDNSASRKSKNNSKKKFNFSVLQLSILIGVAALIVIYLGFALYFKDRFLFGSEINNVNVAGKTVDEANDMISKSTDNYELTINGRNGVSSKILAKDINLKYEKDSKVDEFKNNQNSLAWIVSIFKSDSTEAKETLSYDNDALKTCYDSLSIFSKENMIEPKNATIKKENGEFVIKDEDLGSKVDKDKLFPIVQDAIKTGKDTIDIDENDCYVKPELTTTSDKIVNTKNDLDKFSNVIVTYNIRNKTEVLDSATIKSWLSIDDNLNINIDDESATNFVKNLANKYDTAGGTRKFKSTNRGEIEVSGGTYGWKINVTDETNELFKVIRAGQSVTREPIYSVKPINNSGDIGNSYVEVDLGKQHLWMYINGQLIIESDVVSGDGSGIVVSDTPTLTPAGTYYICYKESPSVLRGDGYETPVSYWMPFNGGIGLHDATWRSQFGGELYKDPNVGGSHGCVNLPLNVAAEIYKHAYSGLPVICYY